MCNSQFYSGLRRLFGGAGWLWGLAYLRARLSFEFCGLACHLSQSAGAGLALDCLQQEETSCRDEDTMGLVVLFDVALVLHAVF